MCASSPPPLSHRHIESPSTIFGTGMNYTAMRLLGVPMEDDRMKRAREFLAANDGCKGIPSWVRDVRPALAHHIHPRASRC